MRILSALAALALATSAFAQEPQRIKEWLCDSEAFALEYGNYVANGESEIVAANSVNKAHKKEVCRGPYLRGIPGTTKSVRHHGTFFSVQEFDVGSTKWTARWDLMFDTVRREDKI